MSGLIIFTVFTVIRPPPGILFMIGAGPAGAGPLYIGPPGALLTGNPGGPGSPGGPLLICPPCGPLLIGPPGAGAGPILIAPPGTK